MTQHQTVPASDAQPPQMRTTSSGLSLNEKITADSDRDRWFTAEEALDHGFVDHIANRANLPSS